MEMSPEAVRARSVRYVVKKTSARKSGIHWTPARFEKNEPTASKNEENESPMLASVGSTAL